MAWSSLNANEEASGWRTIAVTRAGPCRLAAGRHFPGKEEALLVGFSDVSIPTAEKLPDGGGFNVERVDPFGDGATWLALSRKASGNIELFLTM
ncbi:MAG: PD-(D/E)XK motif protein, partial [Acidobacteriaceae bacterium]